MSQYGRYNDFAGNKYHWVDCELCIIMDSVTGELQRFGKNYETVGTFEEAMKSQFRHEQSPNRNVIIKFNAIKSFEIVDIMKSFEAKEK